jgi:hypothetical protein
MSENIVTVSASPILSNHFFFNIKRPSNRAGFDGILSGAKETPGLEDILDVVMDPWIQDLREGRAPKSLIIFCKVCNILFENNHYFAQFCIT